MTRIVLRRLLPVLLIASLPALVVADQARQATGPSNGPDLSSAKPGRAPDQPIDAEYTAKIREYTTEEFFLSPQFLFDGGLEGVLPPNLVAEFAFEFALHLRIAAALAPRS